MTYVLRFLVAACLTASALAQGTCTGAVYDAINCYMFAVLSCIAYRAAHFLGSYTLF
jgi:hypothetical protein